MKKTFMYYIHSSGFAPLFLLFHSAERSQRAGRKSALFFQTAEISYTGLYSGQMDKGEPQGEGRYRFFCRSGQ